MTLGCSDKPSVTTHTCHEVIMHNLNGRVINSFKLSTVVVTGKVAIGTKTILYQAVNMFFCCEAEWGMGNFYRRPV